MNIKEQYYKYGESLGIKVNDLQRLKILSDKCHNDILQDQTVTRFEVIDENGRVYVAKDCKIELSYQDDGRTLKVFIKKKQLKTNKMEQTKKQTGVEWLVSQLYRYSFNQPIDLGVWQELRDLAEQAKEMENQQLKEKYDNGYINGQRDLIIE